MRQLLALAAVALFPRGALADRVGKAPIDISDVADKLDVLRDDVGKIYIVASSAVPPRELGAFARKYTFYGDGKTMYQQRVESTSIQSGNTSWGVWSPRTRGLHHASIEVSKEGTKVTCRMQHRKHDAKVLTRLPDEEAKKILASAKFLPPLWEYQPYFFGRGESTVYYLVDALRDELGGGGHRLFIGRKGQMKQHAITDIAEDSAGTLIETKAGRLEIKDESARWKVGARTIDIIKLPAFANRYLIHRELGVYGQLGTVCEDQ